MNTIWIVIGILLLAWWAVRLVATVRADGYGLRPPPRSHEDHSPDGSASGWRYPGPTSHL